MVLETLLWRKQKIEEMIAGEGAGERKSHGRGAGVSPLTIPPLSLPPAASKTNHWGNANALQLWRINECHMQERLLTMRSDRGVLLKQPDTAYASATNYKERTIQRKQAMITYRAEEPMKLGTDEYEASIKGEEKQQLNVVVLPNKEIWVLPATFVEGQKSQHSIIAKGNPCVWTGEVKIEGRKVTRMKDQSGHFKTYHYRDAIQKAIEDFALHSFRQQGYEVPEVIERTGKGRGSLVLEKCPLDVV